MIPADHPVIRRLAWRILPVLGVMYVISFLDRVNLGFAALTMNAQLGISPVEFGSAAGVFFLGYLLFQVPANLLLMKLGARRWMALIMLLWGLVSMAMALVKDTQSLMIARFALGMAEAGFFPGAILYLTLWFPPVQRARIVSLFMIAAPVAYIIGAPLSGVILGRLDGWHGLAGWQWLFVIEAAPAVLLAPLVLWLLQDRPQESTWLTEPDRDWLLPQLIDRSAGAAPAARTRMSARLMLYALVYFGLQLGVYGIGLWLPQIVGSSGLGPSATGWLSAIPYLFAVPAMLYWGNRATDARGQRVSSVALPMAAAGIVLAGSAFLASFPLRLTGLTVMTMCLFVSIPMFWAYATSTDQPLFGPLGIGIVNSAGSIGGFTGPVLVGWVQSYATGFGWSLTTMGAILLASGTVIGLALAPIRPPREVQQ